MYEEYIDQQLKILQPCSYDLGYKLTQIGGKRVGLSLDPLNERILHEGNVYNQKPILIQMKDGFCHRNVWDIYQRHLDFTIHSGYVLYQNSVWTRHSFLIDNKDRIIETTYPLEKVSIYYGVQVTPKEFLDVLLRMGLIHLEYKYGFCPF